MRCNVSRASCRSTRKDWLRSHRTLAFNTAVSFATNTNWQGYGGETTMSYLTQMLALTVQNFVSAATGMAVLIALTRGIVRHTAQTVGNFWVDMTRSTLYILMPLAIVLALRARFAGRGANLQLISVRDAGAAGRGCQRTSCHAAGAGRRSGGLPDRH